eukprot:s2837_g10.t1
MYQEAVLEKEKIAKENELLHAEIQRLAYSNELSINYLILGRGVQHRLQATHQEINQRHQGDRYEDNVAVIGLASMTIFEVIGLIFTDIHKVIGLALMANLAVIGLASLDILQVIGLASLDILEAFGLAFLANMEVIGPALLVNLAVIGLALRATLARIGLASLVNLAVIGLTYMVIKAVIGLALRDILAVINLGFKDTWVEVKRLEQCATTLLLGVIPDDIKGDLISQKELWPAAIMYKILRTYCPGDWRKRAQLLQELASTTAAKDAASAASTLRLWKRQRARALEVGILLPDLMIQAKALGAIVMNGLRKQPQTLCNVSTFRMEVHLEERPIDAAVEQYLELIMAEMDYSSHTVGTLQEKAKILQGKLPQGKTGNRPCKYWGTTNGYKYGQQCRFTHGPVPKDGVERCWHCSAPGYRKPDCPALATGNGQFPAKTGRRQPGGQIQSPGGNAGGSIWLSSSCDNGVAARIHKAALPDLNGELQIPVGTTGPERRTPDRTRHCRTSSASSRSQWALPDLNCELQISVGTADLNCQLQIAPGTAGLHLPAPDLSGHCRISTASSKSQWALPTSAASSRSQWAMPHLNREVQIPVGIADL